MDKKQVEHEVSEVSRTGASTSSYPPQPHHIQATSRTITIHYDSWKGNKARVIDEDETTILYTIDMKIRKPQMIFKLPDSDTVIGTTTFHALTTRIDVTVQDHSIEMHSKGYFKNGYAYTSPAFQNATMTWKSESGWKYFDLVCLDDQQVPIARFVANSWGIKKVGKFEFLGPKAISGLAMDEIVVLGLALAESILDLDLFEALPSRPSNCSSLEAQETVTTLPAPSSST